MNEEHRRPARVLSIAGSDSGGGAGIQADLKTFEAFGAFGMTAITAVTAQNTLGVDAVLEVPGDLIRRQIKAVIDDLGVDAIKVGMLPSAETVAVVADTLDSYPPRPLVLDPVLVATSGDRLSDADSMAVMKERLFERTTVLTPNLPEAEELTGSRLENVGDRADAARALCALGCSSVLVKGGHGDGDRVVDVFFDGVRVHLIQNPRIETRSTHGTGCTLSSAIAVGLGQGLTLMAAVERAIGYVQGAIRSGFELGSGAGPVNHGFRAR